MNFHILTLFPDMVEQGLNTSIIGRALGYGPRCREFESSHARGKRTLNLCLAEIWGLFII